MPATPPPATPPPAAPPPSGSVPPPGAPAPPPLPGFRELARLLRAAGLDPSAEELADALWLAGRIGPPAQAPAGPADELPAHRTPPQDEPPPEEEPVPAPADTEDPVRLYASRVRGTVAEEAAAFPAGAGVPVRVPGAAALPRILEIQRALRSLQRHRPPGRPTRLVLDEPATAEASARALGLVIPVMRPETRREATVRLVMDASPSMAVWQDMFEELRSVCERLGAFRDVQVHYLHRLADGRAALGRAPGAGGRLRSGDQLRDPSGRALTMVVSDCAGPLWREGEAQRVLHRWAECTPCAVVQPLPQRLWARSWLPTERGTLARVEGATAARLRFRADRPARPGRPAGGLTVPVLPPNASALGAWARLVAGLGTGPVPAEVGRVLADHPAAPVPPPRAARPPRDLVRRFRSSASPRAVQLAVYLSAAPLTLPVMRLVQRTMLPDSEPSDLAEVLLSGLLRRGSAPGQWYEFVPGVQDVLLGPLGRDEAALVLKHCSEYVLAHFGSGVRNFPALAVSQLTGAPVVEEGGDGRVPAGRLPQAFAEVSARVVRRYLPGPAAEDTADREPPAPPPGRAWAVRTARERLAAQDAEGAGGRRGLYEAVAVLRRAVAAPAAPDDPAGEAECELAGALLRLWAQQRDPELLAEAGQLLAGLPTAPARALLGRVLYARAFADRPDRPDRPDAELLAAAAREFAAAAAAPDGDPPLRLDCVLRRARTLVALGELREDTGALREARAALEALAGPDPGAAGPAVRRALGRVLVALLPRTPDPAERTALAEGAAGHLESVLHGAPQAPGAETPAETARIRVDLATALRYLPPRLEEAAGQLDLALAESAGDPELLLAALVCLARVHRARHARDADPAALEAAAEAYARARRLIPRDGEAYGELLPEWGDALLDRARAAGGRRFTSQAVRVLRDSRSAVPQSDPRSAHRLVRLAEGLRLRHGYEGDVVDLREAEYLLELAVRQSRKPLEQARAWREHGDVQQEIHAHTRALDRLDRAADSYRRAWRAALDADRTDRTGLDDGADATGGAERPGAAVEVAARAQEMRGEVLERLARPRAALDAYRSALELWRRLGERAADRREALGSRIRTLEAGM
ncbi:SAV_2336 N-terminal domain-related protein [Streptomyces sp. NPDC046866]|uniref:SAV_2336 N-terminal domain-related protein n=1 Tax=Streptomyces sp. NPDC046866 TaxID=3154921 RepID=UPI003452186B